MSRIYSFNDRIFELGSIKKIRLESPVAANILSDLGFLITLFKQVFDSQLILLKHLKSELLISTQYKRYRCYKYRIGMNY